MDIRKRKVVYQEGKIASSSIDGTNKRYFGWKLPIEKEGKAVITLDFTKFSNRPKLARMFMMAVDGLSSQRGAKTLQSYTEALPYFWKFLDDMDLAGTPISEPGEINSKVVKSYIAWLKSHNEWAIGSLYSYYKGLKPLLKSLKRHHKEDIGEIDFPLNPFPRKNAQAVHNPAYSPSVAEQIKNAVLSDIEDIKRRVETPYVRTGKGVDPRGRHRNLWKDFDNVVWYFENILDCQYRGQQWLQNNGHSSFAGLALRYHKGLSNVWHTLGVWHGTTLGMLIPFILLFSYLSGANTTPILTMRRDCIKDHPYIPNSQFLKLEKGRSGKESYKVAHSRGCILIVNRVLEITKDLAIEAEDDVKDYLWLYRGRKDGRIKYIGYRNQDNIHKPLQEFAKKHDIKDENGALIKLNISNLRPTFATRMFTSTKGDVVKLMKLLNHEYLKTTGPYISNAGLPDMHKDAANDLANHERKQRIHIAVGDVASVLGISKDKADKILSGEYDTYLGKCRALFDSQLSGEKEGKPCTRFNACLFCSHCLVTVDDLPRIFSYCNQINRSRRHMPLEHFEKVYGDTIQAINEIRREFHPDVVTAAENNALNEPLPAWEIKLELADTLDNIARGVA